MSKSKGLTVKRYKNGLRLVAKKIDFVRSVSAGIWVGAGSAYESTANNGISHFIEHMLFKGTETRSAFEIADTLEGLGAQVNAFTSKECTCYYTKSVDEHLYKCLEILSDMLFNSVFAEEELKREQQVVVEEIAMTEDSPEDVCHELLSKAYYHDSPLGMSIIGNEQNVRSFDKTKILGYMKKHYCPENIVISVAGNFDIDELESAIGELFADKFGGDYCMEALAPDRNQPKQIILSRTKQIEQASIALGFPSVAFNSADTYPVMLFNSVIGGGMSSRLFQNVREKMGLAYAVYSFQSSYVSNGLFSVYCGTNPKNTEKAIPVIMSELRKIADEGITKEEFLRGKEQLKGAFILGQENTASIMNVYGKLMLLADEVFDLDRKLDEIKAISFDRVNHMLKQVLDFEKVCCAYVASSVPENLEALVRS